MAKIIIAIPSIHPLYLPTGWTNWPTNISNPNWLQIFPFQYIHIFYINSYLNNFCITNYSANCAQPYTNKIILAMLILLVYINEYRRTLQHFLSQSIYQSDGYLVRKCLTVYYYWMLHHIFMYSDKVILTAG